MYIAEIGQAVLKLLSLKLGQGITIFKQFSDDFSIMTLVPLNMISHLTSHKFQILKIEIFSKLC